MITATLVAAAQSVAAATETEELNPLLPERYDIIWSLVIVVILFFVFQKYALPKFQAVLDERTEKIEGGLQHAEAAQAEAAALRAEYEQQLADARTEAARIKEAARAEGGVDRRRDQGARRPRRRHAPSRRPSARSRPSASRRRSRCVRTSARSPPSSPRRSSASPSRTRPASRAWSTGSSRTSRRRTAGSDRRQGELMRGTSLASLAAAQERFEPVLAAAGKQAADLGEQLFAVVDALDSSGSLRRTLSDPAIAADAKAGGRRSGPGPVRRARRRRRSPTSCARAGRPRTTWATPSSSSGSTRCSRPPRRAGSSSASRTRSSGSPGRSSASARCAPRSSTPRGHAGEPRRARRRAARRHASAT